MYPISFLSGSTFLPGSGSDWLEALKVVCILALGIFSVGAILRAVFGKGSSLTRSISATLNLILIYISAIAAYFYFPSLRDAMQRLPFLALAPDHFYLLDLSSMSWDLFFSSLLQLAVLALFVNMLESWLPKGKNLLSWYALRLTSSLCSFGLYLGFCYLTDAFMPMFFGSWAKWILLVFWGVILLVAALKLLFSAVLTVLNPILGACYTFFFSNLFGSQFSKAILTSVFSLLIISYLGKSGYAQVVFSQLTLSAYAPASLILLVALYLFGKFL